jgi:hypothetical protein
VALRSDPAAEKLKDQLPRDFRVIRFSTFATKLANSRPLRVGLELPAAALLLAALLIRPARSLSTRFGRIDAK